MHEKTISDSPIKRNTTINPGKVRQALKALRVIFQTGVAMNTVNIEAVGVVLRARLPVIAFGVKAVRVVAVYVIALWVVYRVGVSVFAVSVKTVRIVAVFVVAVEVVYRAGAAVNAIVKKTVLITGGEREHQDKNTKDSPQQRALKLIPAV